ncbi:MAG: hypothetical protein Kow0068_20680 [Marinilabiliales bacterium]
MKAFIIILLSIIFIIRQGAGQTEIIQNNLTKLEDEVKVKIDSLRIKNGCSSLWNDSALYISAKEHANYLLSITDISIFETSRKLSTPQKRIAALGRNSYRTTEIISEIYLDTNQSYPVNKLGEMIFNNHLDNIVNKACILSCSFEIHGLAIVFDKNHNRLIIVEDLAIPPENYNYIKYSLLFPFDDKMILTEIEKSKKKNKYPYKLKSAKKDKHCKNSDDVMRRINGAYVTNEDGRIIINMDNASVMGQLLKKKYDGLVAVEIDNDDYPCQGENNLHIKGDFHRPVYMEQLLNNSFQTNSLSLKKSIAYVKSENKNVEANIYVIQNKRVCNLIGPAKICGKAYSYTVEPLKYINNLSDVEYMPPVDYDTLRLKLFYKVGEITPDSNKLKPLVDFLKNEGLVITNAYIMANASIEGNKEQNKTIFNERADYILNLFEKEQKYPIRLKVKTQENWDLFYHQIENTKYGFLKEKDTAYVRQFVNDSIDLFREWLDNQRYASITLFAVNKITRDKFKVYALNDYKELLNSIKQSKTQNNDLKQQVEKLENIQLYLFQMYREGEVSGSFLKLLTIPDNVAFIELKYNELLFKYFDIKPSDRINETDFFIQLNNLINKGLNNSGSSYNLIAYIINNYGDPDLENYQNPGKFSTINKNIDQLKIPDYEYDKIQFHFNYLKTIEYLESSNFKKGKSDLNNMYSYIIKYKNTPGEIINIANYYILFGFYDEVFDIIEKAKERFPDNVEIINLYLKIKYLFYWRETRDSDYYSDLFESVKIIGEKNWCNLFNDKCGLSLQLFEYEPLFKMYCILLDNQN